MDYVSSKDRGSKKSIDFYYLLGFVINECVVSSKKETVYFNIY